MQQLDSLKPIRYPEGQEDSEKTTPPENQRGIWK